MYILKSLYAFFHVHFREEVYEPMEWIPALSWGHVTFPFLSVRLNFIFISAVHFEVKLNQAFGDGFKATLKTWVSLLTLPALHRSRLTDSPCVIHSPVNHHSVIVVRISACAISPTHTLSCTFFRLKQSSHANLHSKVPVSDCAVWGLRDRLGNL